MEASAEEKIIVALDVDTKAEALSLVGKLPDLRWCKVGLQLFLGSGFSLVEELRQRGLRVFLDLKVHDIPNTVEQAVRVASSCGAEMTTIHLSGGGPMIRAALEGARENNVLVLGVSVLTSMKAEELRALGVEAEPDAQVVRLAGLGFEQGLRGVVASPREAAALREKFGPELKIVTPGVRPAGSAAGDQSRTLTPAEAVRAGADWLVIGRPITQAESPERAFAAVAEEIRQA